METKPIKILEKLTTQYSKFNKNQVLTEKQLNEFLDYFNDQDHLSRVGLSGVGIVCGFDVSFAESVVKITQGYGVTTDGDLLKLKNLLPNQKEFNYTHYKIFEDNIANYAQFYNNETKIELLELKNLTEIADGDTSYLPLSDLNILEDKVVLLYLENYQKGTDLCTELSCDNQGLEQVANLKVLLVSVSDAKKIAALDSIYTTHNWSKTFLELPEVNARRIVLTNANTKKLNVIKQNFAKAIKSNDILTKLAAGYDTVFLKFGRNSISNKITTLLNLFSIPTDFQYRYDLFKDLIDTYNEIKELLLHINVECCPNIGAFPKHLLLGRLNETEVYKTLRHQFYKSPIVGHEDKNYRKVLLLLDRANELINNYEIKDDVIKITPSQINTALTNKAIPFYYNVNNDVLDSWSFKKTDNLSQKLNLSYHTDNLADIDSIKNPLLYSIEGNNFFRIEGHQGKMYQDALDQVLNLKRENGLNFDVKVLSINATSSSINIDDYKCEFEELSMLLKAWRTEQNCILAEMSRFFSGFSTVEAGGNIISAEAGLEIASGLSELPKAAKGLKKGLLATSSKTKINNPKRLKFNYIGGSDYSNVNFNNVVVDQLTTQDDTLGQYLEIAIAENSGGSANDIMATFQDQVGPIRDSETWTAEVELADFIFDNVAETLVDSYILDNVIPNEIHEIGQLTLDTYKLTIDKLCKKVKTLQARYQSKNIKEGSKEILGLLINQMSTVCCSGKKLEILLDEIEKRKNEILLQTQLSEFVKNHPGLEHQAGVEKGGTFVMVYLAENVTDKTTYQTVTMELDFLEQPNIDDDGTDGDEGVLKLWNERVSTNFAFLHKVTNGTQNPKNEIVFIGNTIEQTVANFANFLNNIWRRAGFTHNCVATASGKKITISLIDINVRDKENFIQFYNPSIVGRNTKIFFSENQIDQGNITTKNTIVADFSLPYMCCSDCTPVNFIIQNTPEVTTLDIVNNFCLDVGTEEFVNIPFTNINPVDGLIEVVGGEIKGLEIVDGQLIINPLVFVTFNQEITFTVNGLPTTASISIHKIPDIIIEASQPVYNDNNTATVTFVISGDDLNDITTFTWDFEGNDVTTVEIPIDNTFIHEYDLPVGKDNIVTPILVIDNGFCDKEFNLNTITFQEQDVVLIIPNKICLTNADFPHRFSFTVTPPNGIVSIVEQNTGLSIDNTTHELVVALSFANYGQQIEFLVNNIPTPVTTEIYLTLSTQVNGSEGDFNWIGSQLHKNYSFNIRLPINTSIEWFIDNVLVGTNDTLDHNFLLDPNGQNTFTIRVDLVDSNQCIEINQLPDVVINYPNFTGSLPSNQLDFCLDDKGSYPITVNPNIPNTVVNGLGVNNNEFIPSSAGLTTSGSIQFDIAGQNILTINMNSKPTADFEVIPDPSILILENISSSNSKRYEWILPNEAPIIRLNRLGIRRPKSNYHKNIIDVSIVAINDCGKSEIVTKQVVLNTFNCVEDTTGLINNENTKILNTELIKPDIQGVSLPTRSEYATVIKSLSLFLSGNRNSELTQIFSVTLFNKTEISINNHKNDTIYLAKLAVYYTAQIKLFYLILKCQEERILIDDANIISEISAIIKNSLINLNNNNVAFDVSGELLSFLTNYSCNSTFINNKVHNELAILIL